MVRVAALVYAISLIDNQICRRALQQSECKTIGQDRYVENLSAQIAQLEGYRDALTQLANSAEGVREK